MAAKQICYNYLVRHSTGRIVEILNDDPPKTYNSILLDFSILNQEEEDLANHLINSPNPTLNTFNQAAKQLMMSKNLEITGQASLASDPAPLGPKLNLFIRVHSLPEHLCKKSIPSCREYGRLICLAGTIVRVTEAKVLEYVKNYECKKCQAVIPYEASQYQSYRYPASVSCPNNCPRSRAVPVNDLSPKVCDFQQIRVQEQVSSDGSGSISKTITALIQNDLVGTCQVGDDVSLGGYLYLTWGQFRDDRPLSSELVFSANHIEVTNKKHLLTSTSLQMTEFITEFWDDHRELDPFFGKHLIISSFCPEIYGMEMIKLGLCLVLAGGVSREVGGSKIRGQCHMLLVGPPGTGKSQLLKYASLISPRSVRTTGIGTSSAGLTVAAVRENGEFHLEPGACLLANGGTCVIDEFLCMQAVDRVAMHEIMEQQTISVAKAGIVSKLKCNTTILAACNPTNEAELNGPLMSRFDLMMILKDSEIAEWDEYISDFILCDKRSERSGCWTLEQLRVYFLIIKDLKPELSPDAVTVIQKYYLHTRSNVGESSNSRTTVRLLESLKRLAEGHARLMFSTSVTVYDVISVIGVIEAAPSVGYANINAALPSDPLMEYKAKVVDVLTKLELPQILEAELRMIQGYETMRTQMEG